MTLPAPRSSTLNGPRSFRSASQKSIRSVVTSEFLNKMITSTVISGQRAGWICIEDWDADHTMRGDEEEVFGPPNRHSTTADTSQREVSHPRTLRFTKSARVSRLTLSRRDASQPYSFEHLVGPHPYTCRRYLSPRWSVSANPRTPRPADGPHLAYASEYGRPQPTQGCSRPPHCRHLGEGQTRHLATTSPHVATFRRRPGRTVTESVVEALRAQTPRRPTVAIWNDCRPKERRDTARGCATRRFQVVQT
jgi:hypothetical protein